MVVACSALEADWTWASVKGEARELLGSKVAEPKEEITFFTLTVPGEVVGPNVTINWCCLVIGTSGQKEVWAPREQPLNVRTLDRVVRRDVQRVVVQRFADPAPPPPYDMTDEEIDALFDGSKETCVVPRGSIPANWAVGDQILVIFKEAVEASRAEVQRKVARISGAFLAQDMITDVVGNWLWVFPNLATPDGSSSDPEAVICAKVSAVLFEFGEVADNICEFMVKTFSYSDACAPAPGGAALKMMTVDIARAAAAGNGNQDIVCLDECDLSSFVPDSAIMNLDNDAVQNQASGGHWTRDTSRQRCLRVDGVAAAFGSRHICVVQNLVTGDGWQVTASFVGPTTLRLAWVGLGAAQPNVSGILTIWGCPP